MKISKRQLRRLISEAMINESSDQRIATHVEKYLNKKGYKFTIGDIGEGDAIFRIYFEDYRGEPADDNLHRDAINSLKKAGFNYDYVVTTSDFVRWIPIAGPFLPNTKIISVYPKGMKP